MLWRNQSGTNEKLAVLAEKNSHLRDQLSTARSELDFFKTGDSRAGAKKTPIKAATSVTKSAEEPETLFLQEPSVIRTGSGLIARFGFDPVDSQTLPEMITLVIRVPSKSETTILSLKPVTESAYSNVDVVVNAKGNLGMIEGSPADLQALEFELTVSGPATVTVRGSKGIKAFEMDVAESGCTVRKL
ncbi:MAG: hypothetical protein HKP10_05845 [Kiritimatiellales bacterium]|nr:hypothetical protein [Kiritimatiellales bacterium]